MVGQMACGAAHEINNPLAVVVGRAQLLVSQVEDEKQKQNLNLITQQAQAATHIITELLQFAQPEPPRAKEIRFEELFNLVSTGCRELMDQCNVRLMRKLDDQAPLVFVDSGQVAAALIEVVKNAVQASKDGGQVIVTAAANTLDDTLKVQVIDQGSGMDDATAEHAFDPFFSARPAGRSRGLGLSRAMRFLEVNHGPY